MRRLVVITALLAALLAPATVSAAQKDGCPASASDWELMTVTGFATLFFPHLLPGQWETLADFTAAIATYDGNGDGWICAKITTGEEYNPQSHWAGTWFAITRDNNANGS